MPRSAWIYGGPDKDKNDTRAHLVISEEVSMFRFKNQGRLRGKTATMLLLSVVDTVAH